MSVLSPIAAIAIMMKNFERLLRGLNTEALTPAATAIVVMTEARRKNRMKNGKTFLRLKEPVLAVFALLVFQMARTKVIGMIARVRVSLTMVAVSSVLAPGWRPSHAEAAAVTDDVSFTAVPAKSAKPWLERPNADPRDGKIRAARMLKRKITEIACATSSSSAPMTGAVAAIAEPPQIDDPTPMSVEMFEGILISL